MNIQKAQKDSLEMREWQFRRRMEAYKIKREGERQTMPFYVMETW